MSPAPPHAATPAASADIRYAAAPDGAHLVYEIAGTRGPVLVLLHSLGADRRMWDPVRGELDGRYRHVIPDLRGHGGSGGGQENTQRQWPGDLAAILDSAAPCERVVLAGVSLGGIHAISFAAAHPDRVAGLVVADSFVELPAEVAEQKVTALQRHAHPGAMADLADRYLADTFTEPYPDGGQAVRKAIAATDAETYRHAVASCFTVQLTDRLQAVSAPTLVLWGDRDQKTPRHLSEAIVAGIAGARFSVIPDAGHLSNIDNPAAFAHELNAFIDGIGGTH